MFHLPEILQKALKHLEGGRLQKSSWKVEETGGVSVPPERWKTRNLPRIITFIIFITVIFLAGGARVAHATDVTNIDTVFLVGMILLFGGLAEKFIDDYNTQKNCNQRKSKGNSDIGIYGPKIRIIHKSFLSSLNDKNKQIVPRSKSIVKTKIVIGMDLKPAKFGTINTAAYQAAERFIVSAEIALKAAFLSFLLANIGINPFYQDRFLLSKNVIMDI